jgi:hypothetical protein
MFTIKFYFFRLTTPAVCFLLVSSSSLVFLFPSLASFGPCLFFCRSLRAMDETELQHLYAWIDGIPLSRPKRNIGRDFSDGGKPQAYARSHVRPAQPGCLMRHSAGGRGRESFRPTARGASQLFPGQFQQTEERQLADPERCEACPAIVAVRSPTAGGPDRPLLRAAKVFKRLGLTVPESVIKGAIACKAGVVEVVLSNLRIKLEQYLQRGENPESRQQGGSESAEWNDFDGGKRKPGHKQRSPGPYAACLFGPAGRAGVA